MVSQPAAIRREWTARTFLIIALLTIVVPIVAFIAWTVWQFGKAEEARFENAAQEAAERITDAVDRELSKLVSALQVLATSRLLDDHRYEELHRQATEIRALIRAELIIKDETGQQLINTRLPFGSPLPLSLPQPDQEALRLGRPYVSDLFQGAVARSPIVSVYVPIIRGGRIVGLAIAGVDPADLASLLRVESPAGWISGLIDRNDRLLARSREHDRFFGELAAAAVRAKATGQRGSWTSGESTLEGVPVLTAYERSELSGWRTAVGVPLAVIRAPLERTFLWLGLFGACAAIISLALAKLFGSMIARPLRLLAEAAIATGRGESGAFPSSKIREVNAVSRAFEEAALQLKRHAEHRELVMHELSHRSKNLLAVVQAMIRLAPKSSRSIEEFEESVRKRIAALANVHDLLVASSWRGAPIRDVIETQLRVFQASGRFETQGPELLINAGFAQTLGIAIHELATNAVKYGALSNAAGSINLCWSLSSTDDLVITWSEHGGPPVVPPDHQGFGTFVLRRVAPASAGKAGLEFLPEGVRWTWQVPFSEAMEQQRPTFSPKASTN